MSIKFLRLVVLALLSGTLAGCALPAIDNKATHSAISDAEGFATRLGQALAPDVAKHPEQSGIYAVPNAEDAFVARMLLAKVAEKSIDAQYYIWHRDITGLLMLEELYHAAQRGVRVRVLIDDNGVGDFDELLAGLDRHPNFHVRLFNPFPVRSAKWLGYLTDFSRLNRRMHNKSFTVDNQATVIGGRNIGDEYFGATNGVLFNDLDVMAIGPIVPRVSSDFDRYWNHQLSYPATSLLGKPSTAPEIVLDTLKAKQDSGREQRYLAAIRQSDFLEQIRTGTLKILWADTQMASDSPDKILSRAKSEALLSRQLGEIIGTPEKSLTLISPYFIPTKQGLDYFSALADDGVQVRILTNALEATDVAAVHSGYMDYREPLVAAGVELYEMRKQDTGAIKRNKSTGPLGSSGSSLHAKTFIVDGRKIFVGSFNFDPRSINLNTELGFVIESPELADTMERTMTERLPSDSYRLSLNRDGDLYWVEETPSGKIIHSSEPYTPAGRRFLVWLMSILPLEPLL